MMVFKARKTRQKKEQEPLVKGGAMRPSAAIKDWYERQLRSLVTAMMIDYRETIVKVMQYKPVKEFYAQDAASPTDAFTRAFADLHGKWKSVFIQIGRKIAKEFTEKIDEHNKSTVHKALSTLGVEQPRLTYTENINHTLEATQEFNHTLITGLQQEAHERIFNVIMLSLTSPNPEEQGQPYIISHLRDVEGMTKKRAKLIARDQTAKAYSALNIERAKEAGVQKFIWRHSSAGKVPRYTHVQKDGQVFELNDPKLWEGPKADQGPPGFAINCRCYLEYVLTLE